MKTSLCFVLFLFLSGTASYRLDELESKTYLDEFLSIAFKHIPLSYYGGDNEADGELIAQNLKLSAPYKFTKKDKQDFQVSFVEKDKREQILTIKYGTRTIFEFLRKDITNFNNGFFQYKISFDPKAESNFPTISEDSMAKLAAIAEMKDGDKIEEVIAVDVDESKEQTPYIFKFMKKTTWRVFPFTSTTTATANKLFGDKATFEYEALGSDHAYRFIVKNIEDIKKFDKIGFTIENYRPFLLLSRSFTQLPESQFTNASTAERVNIVWQKAKTENGAAALALSIVETENDIFEIKYTEGVDALATEEQFELFAKLINQYYQNDDSGKGWDCVGNGQSDKKFYICHKLARRIVL